MFAFFVANRLLTPNIDKKTTKKVPQKLPKCQKVRPQKSLFFPIKSTEVILKNSTNTTSLDTKLKNKKLSSPATILTDLGIEAETLDNKNLENIEGVIILKIEKNSIIENTNMEREFIITMVNNEKIKSLDDFTNAIANAENEVILDGFYEKYPGEYSYVFDKD